MRVAELDYDLPEELIAQEPLAERDAARLLVLDRDGAIDHRSVRDLPELVPPALFVVNDTRVIPARVFGTKPTGGRVELLLLERIGEPGAEERWRAMGRASKGFREGSEIALGGGAVTARVAGRSEEGDLEVVLVAREGTASDAIERFGQVPLPPYIRRDPRADDRERYQTVFAARAGAVAAPTAGLHLSERLVAALEAKGHRIARVTLHVGAGTFQPVRGESLEEHEMHSERWEVSQAAADAIADAKRGGREIVAVGTTVVRTLETAAREGGEVRAGGGRTSIFIHPPYRFRAVDTLLTNFHLPRSTLLALVMAFGGKGEVRRAYAEAIRARYRFFSYGDAMLLRGRRP